MATRQSGASRPGASGSEGGAGDPELPQKKRARHRLIGALVVCAVAAVVVPLLLESEPTRPVSDLPIVIPPRDLPLPPRIAEPKSEPPADPVRAGTVARGSIEPAAAAAPRAGEPSAAAGARPDDTKAAAARPSDPKVAAARAVEVSGAESKGADAKAAAPKPVPPKAPEGPGAAGKAPEPARDEIARLVESRLRGETAGRYLLQVGAYGSQAGADAAVGRVTALGLQAFTERIKTDRGDRIRVRVGPFPTREAAQQARERLKTAGIEAAMIAP